MCTLLAGGVIEGIHVECLDGCRLAVQLSFVLQRIVIAYDDIRGIYVKGFCGEKGEFHRFRRVDIIVLCLNSS